MTEQSVCDAPAVATRLESQFPEVARRLLLLDRAEQVELLHQVATRAAAAAGQVVPAIEEVSIDWATRIDDAGWWRDESGEWTQHPACFLRARAAFAVLAAHHSGLRPEDLSDGLYESAIVLGSDAVIEAMQL